MIMEKMMNKKTEGNTFTKKIGQTVYVVRYHFNEDAKETMQGSGTVRARLLHAGSSLSRFPGRRHRTRPAFQR